MKLCEQISVATPIFVAVLNMIFLLTFFIGLALNHTAVKIFCVLRGDLPYWNELLLFFEVQVVLFNYWHHYKPSSGFYANWRTLMFGEDNSRR